MQQYQNSIDYHRITDTNTSNPYIENVVFANKVNYDDVSILKTICLPIQIRNLPRRYKLDYKRIS